MANELVEEGIEQVAEAAETVAAEATQIADATRRLSARNVGFFFGGIAIGLAGGAAIGYFVFNKKLETKYQKIADKEIAEMTEHYRRLRVALQGEAQRRRPLEELLVDYGYTTRLEGPDEIIVVKVEPEDLGPRQPFREEDRNQNTEVTVDEAAKRIGVNVFEQAKPDNGWDFAVETKARHENRPYILHKDEYMADERDYSQTTITYYQGDEVLVDERDGVMDKDRTVGLENLERFGHGADDVNLLYIRNPVIEAEYEIIRSEGKYAIEVLGLEEENNIQHSDMRRHRPQRGFDDDET